jgi:3-oxoacyl-(acyl-carrier-protein) synthase
MDTNTKRIVVTGIGVVNPSGMGADNFWENVTNGQVSIDNITRFNTKNNPIKIAAQINDFKVSDYIPKRIIGKTDLFTHYALAAVDMSLLDSNLDITQEDEYKCGIFFGNNSGGWDISERGYYEMYNEGEEYVNPWQATAWFPAAPQGYIAIKNKLKGLSKTFVADSISGASALYFAIDSILNSRNDICIVGGTEAPITPLGTLCYHASGQLSECIEPSSACIPFNEDSTGIVLGEGSASIIIEEMEHAKNRGAKIYGEITGWSMNVGIQQESESIEQCMKETIQMSNTELEDISLLLPEGNGFKVNDESEKIAINNIWRKASDKLSVAVPKALFGHLYGGATATDVICGLLAIKTGKVPICKNIKNQEYNNFKVIKEQSENNIVENILVNSRSREGANVSFMISIVS